MGLSDLLEVREGIPRSQTYHHGSLTYEGILLIALTEKPQCTRNKIVDFLVICFFLTLRLPLNDHRSVETSSNIHKKSNNWKESRRGSARAGKAHHSPTSTLTFSPRLNTVALAMLSHGSGWSHFTEIFFSKEGGNVKCLSLRLPEDPNTQHLAFLWVWLPVADLGVYGSVPPLQA